MSEETYQCPKCGGANFKRWTLPHPIPLHWVLNPGLVVNELILGQRLLKEQLICNDCEGSLTDRSYVPCPHCKTVHVGKQCTGAASFWSWRGFSCPSCKKEVPSLRNLFSLFVLVVTSPVWGLPYLLHFRHQPLKPLYVLENGRPPAPKVLTRRTWIKMGFGFGVVMWLTMSVVLPLAMGGGWERIRSALLIGIPIYALAGFAFGYSMWFFLGRKRG